jgi:hypothetical protein
MGKGEERGEERDCCSIIQLSICSGLELLYFFMLMIWYCIYLQ